MYVYAKPLKCASLFFPYLMGNLARCGTLNYVPPNGGKKIKVSMSSIAFICRKKLFYIKMSSSSYSFHLWEKEIFFFKMSSS